jgi:hypothetical protein
MVTATLCAVPALAPAASGQTTRPAEQAGPAALTTSVWTCTNHEEFRMPIKGACPTCGKDLTRLKVTLQGPGATGDLYPLLTCPVTGLALGEMGPPVVMAFEGREVRFCCKGCIKKFEANAARYFDEIDEKIVKQQLLYYPMTTCPVSGEALGSMGEPINYVHNNRLVRLCCRGCVRSLTNDPAKYIAVLDKAVIAQQTEGYPLTTCVISKQPLGGMGEPVDYVLANRLVRFCCAGCAGAFNRAPGAHLDTLAKAWKKTGGSEREHAKEGKSHDRERHNEHEGHDHDR